MNCSELNLRQQGNLIHSVNINLPTLPAGLAGLRIAHLSDLHIRRRRGRYAKLESLLGHVGVDLIVFTGDYITAAGDEEVGVEVMGQLCASLRPRLGLFGVFGNHDTHKLRQLLDGLPVRWLSNESHVFNGLPLQITGLEDDRLVRPDSVASLFDRSFDSRDSRDAVASDDLPLRLLLCHSPHMIPVAADLGVDLMFSGHTHGGQIRFPPNRALVNSTDLPLDLTSGVLRHRNTLGAISRGLGEVRLPLRILCSPHLPIYTLRRGPLVGQLADSIVNVCPW